MIRAILGTLLFTYCSVGFANTLCNKNENIFFSCKTGKKIISICTSNPIGSTSGYLQYRFGTNNKIQLQHPSSKLHPHNFFTLYSSSFSRGYITHLNFSIGKYSYAVYDTLTGNFSPSNGHTKTSGVKVIYEGKVISDLQCLDTKHTKIYDDLNHLFQKGGGYEYWLFEPTL